MRTGPRGAPAGQPHLLADVGCTYRVATYCGRDGSGRAPLVVDQALTSLCLDWGAWPGVLTDTRLERTTRLSGVLLLLAATGGAEEQGHGFTMVDLADASLDWRGRAREPWASLARMTLPSTAATATTALSLVTTHGPYDDRRVFLALRAARQVCSAGRADLGLSAALDGCVEHLESLERSGQWLLRLPDLLALARRIIVSVTPPELLDLSLVVDGDGWAAPARAAARVEPADDIAPLVRLLTDLGARKPSRRWLRDVETALGPPAARRLLRRWIEAASSTDVVPEWPGSSIGACCGTLFVGSNMDVVRASVWATSVLRAETWPVEHLARLATRGEKHNGAPGFPQALALKVAAAAVEALIDRATPTDRAALVQLLALLQRKDLRNKLVPATQEAPG